MRRSDQILNLAKHNELIPHLPQIVFLAFHRIQPLNLRPHVSLPWTPRCHLSTASTLRPSSLLNRDQCVRLISDIEDAANQTPAGANGGLLDCEDGPDLPASVCDCVGRLRSL